jgi:hypothetical protein
MSVRAMAATVLLVAVLSGTSAGTADGQTGYGYFPWCDPAPGHPIQIALPVPGYVVACRNEDWTSVHLRNVSPYVLRVYGRNGYPSPNIEPVDDRPDAPGVVAAQDAVPSDWYTDGTFRLSLGESAVVSADTPVGVEWIPDRALTAEANIARWAAGRLSQLAEQQQRALPTRWHRRVASCAAGGERLAEGSETIGDVLAIAMSAKSCKQLVSDVLGTNQESAIKRVTGDILYVAKPVAEEEILRQALRFIRG